MSRPQDNPKEQKRMSTQSDASDMSQTETAASDLDGLNVYQRNETTYIVGNPDTGNAYVVNMCNPEHDGTITCQCPDYRFRAQEGEHRACKHIQKVIEVGKSEIGVAQLAHQGLKTQYEILDSKVQSLMQELSNTNANIQHTAETAQSASVPASDAAGDGQQMRTVSAQEAAEKLQAKFNEIVDGFNVEANNGLVWINKTPSAPETLPGPGNVETFYAFLADPEIVKYDGDGEKNPPGQYFKNYLDPSDVDKYISEVLE